MRPRGFGLAALGLLGISWTSSGYRNASRADLLSSDFSLLDDKPDGCPKCPSCFNCNTEADRCHQFATCNKYNGKCSCPSGFGGDDCSEPLCGSLADGDQREPRPKESQTCKCKEGWEGINCNVCKANQACNALMPKNDDGVQEGGVCYKNGLVVKENYQMCNVTNPKILDQLGDQIPQATFSCRAEDETCNFQCKFGSAFEARCLTCSSLGGSARIVLLHS